MDKKEQDILEKIREKSKNIDIPSSLQPENVKVLLTEAEGERKQKKPILRAIKPMRAAAIFCLIILGTAVGVGLYSGGNSSKNEQMLKRDYKTSTKSEQMATAESYEQLFAYIDGYYNENSAGFVKERAGGTAMMEEKSELDTAVGSSGQESANASAAQSYSQTNVRQQGVDEADVAKTDGNSLYVLKDDRTEIGIIDPADGQMQSIGKITAQEGLIEEFYINQSQKKLVYIASILGTHGNVMPLQEDRNIQTAQEQKTMAVTFDIKDPENPKKLGEISQSGSYNSSRMNGDHLYLFTYYYAGAAIAKDKKDSFIPSVNDKILDQGDIYVPARDNANAYVVATGTDIKNPGEITDSKAIFSKGGELYVSSENIYLYEMDGWADKKAVTSLYKLSYKEGELEAVAKNEVQGYLHDSFSIDEYEGNLRIVATVGDANTVYVLDKNLSPIGEIKDIAKGEQVYSARFMGKIGYFVTYRQVDPLFSVDFSDPSNPQIVGELKIPGFSEYLHPYGENKLVGIGMDTDEKTGVSGGIKLTLFDTTDKTDVKEKHTYILENVYSTDVFYDYKAATIDEGRNIIGFAGYVDGGSKYYLFRYDKDKGFELVMETLIHGNTMIIPRGLYIGEVLYVVQGSVIESYSLKDYKKIGDIILS